MQQKPHAGAPGVHGSEPGEPSAKSQNLRISNYRNSGNLPPDPIAVLRCWEPKSKLNLRRKINSIALRARGRAQRAISPDARQEFWSIALLAGQWTFATADEATLDDIRGALLRKALAADSFERNGSGL